jgi:hypothetical protein
MQGAGVEYSIEYSIFLNGIVIYVILVSNDVAPCQHLKIRTPRL